jgi:hypothetical protein
MGTYGLQNVMQLWELEKLTPEQTIGQLLQLLAEFEERLRELETRVSRANGAGRGGGPQERCLKAGEKSAG